MGIPLAQLIAFIAFVRRVIERLSGVGLARTAASLAFTTLLGLVPLFTVAFAYVAKFPLFGASQQALESFLLKFFLPESAGVIHRYLTEFTAKTADLKGIGTVFVIVTAVLLVAEVESEINAIWGVKAPRSLARRIFIYVIGLTAGPAFIGVAVYFMSWLIDESVALVPLRSQTLAILVAPIAFAVQAAAFTFVYGFVPAQRVRFRRALVGGLLAAAAFELAKFGFRLYISHFANYQLIYGALAALPLFLLWLYLTWLIVLAGAAITATLAERDGGVDRT
ncbi:MAG TPA: YihY family inner membrane protein [Casimicrobiaceae bacterium]|nr:YihY family inner membrane protein [Casimicrobiaceae bacterium]